MVRSARIYQAAPSRLWALSASICLVLGIGACPGEEPPEEESSDAKTGIQLTVTFDASLALDQLRVSVMPLGGIPLEPRLIPAQPRPLEPGGEVAELVLADHHAGEEVSVLVEGLALGVVMASGRDQVLLVSGQLVPLALELAPEVVCGDGEVAGDETCDDDNSDAGDGCDDSCAIEAGFVCGTPGQPCTPVCGDGLRVGDESCDDDNIDPGDGCDGSCAIEAGYACPSPGQLCEPVCGDGLVLGDEGCDDQGQVGGDGCDAQCQVEPGFDCSGEPSLCVPACLIGGVVVAEGALDPNDPCYSCQSALDPTGYSVLGDGTPCSNGTFCDGAETCQLGVCTAGASPCSVTTPLCVEAESRCVCEGSSCDDGLFCTGAETCGGDGVCLAGTPLVCTGNTPSCSESLERCIGCEGPSDCAAPNPSCVGYVCTPCDLCLCPLGQHDGGDGSCLPEGSCASGYQLGFIDQDGDDHGAAEPPPECYPDGPLAAGLVAVGDDCDDGDISTWEGMEVFFDSDEDGYTAASASICADASGSAGHFSLTPTPPPFVSTGPSQAASAPLSANTHAWSQVGHTRSPDGQGASSGPVPLDGQSEELRLTDFDLRLPIDAAVSGVAVHVLRRAVGTRPAIEDLSVRLIVGGATSGEDMALTEVDWPQAAGEVVYGGQDELWDLTGSLGPTQLNSRDFGLAIRVLGGDSSGGSSIAMIDHVWIEVFADVGGDCDDDNDQRWTSWEGYRDADQDGHHAPGPATLCLGPAELAIPHFRETTGEDCYDDNEAARPGQTELFDVDRGDGSFDYDCDDLETKGQLTSHGSCECADLVCTPFEIEEVEAASPCGVDNDVSLCVEVVEACFQCTLEVQQLKTRCR